VAESLLNLGALQGYRGDITQGAPFIERAMEILEKDHGGQPTLLANGYNVLATLRDVQGDTSAAVQHIRAAVDLYRTHAPDDPQFVIALHNLATTERLQGRVDQAEAGYRET